MRPIAVCVPSSVIDKKIGRPANAGLNSHWATLIPASPTASPPGFGGASLPGGTLLAARDRSAVEASGRGGGLIQVAAFVEIKMAEQTANLAR